MLGANFCPQCGTPTIKREDGGRLRDACPACDWVYYSNVAVGVGALIVREGRALLVERGIPPVGRWTLPSGWIEQEDTLEAAVKREVREETGLDCTPEGILCIRNMRWDQSHYQRNDTYICFLCSIAPDAVPAPDGDETTRAQFFAPGDLDDPTVAPQVSLFARWVIDHYLAAQAAPRLLPVSRAFDLFNDYPGAEVFAPF